MPKKKRKKAFWIIIIILLLAAATVSALIFKTEILRFFKADVIAKDAGVKHTIAISTGSVGACENGFVYIYSDNGISIYKNNGEFLRSYLLSYSDTSIVFSKTHVIAYDKGTTNYTVFSDGKKVNEFSAKTAITYIFAFDDYMFLLCEGAKGYLGAIYCSAYQNNLIAADAYKNEIQYANKYPIYIDMFTNEDEFVAVCCNPEDMSQTYIEVYAIGKSTPVSAVSLKEFLPKVVCLDKGIFLVAGDTKVALIDTAMTKSIVFDDQEIEYIYGMLSSTYGCGIIDGEDKIFKVNSEGKIDWINKLDTKTQGFLVSENKLMVWQDQRLSMFTNKGNDFHIIETDSLIQQVMAIGKNTLLIITPRNAVIYKY